MIMTRHTAIFILAATAWALGPRPATAAIPWGAYALTEADFADVSQRPEIVINDISTAGGAYYESASASSSAGGSHAAAEASVAHGLLRVSGVAVKPHLSRPDATCCGVSSALAQASIVDAFHFEAAELGRFVPWEITLDGSFFGDPGYRRGLVEWSFDGVEIEHQEFFGGEMTIGGEFLLRQGETEVPILLRLSGDAASGSAEVLGDAGFDLSHTLRFKVHVPQGVTAWSSSGLFQFLSDAPAVPEPSIWALVLAGFGLAGAGLRRARRPGPTAA